MPRKTIPKDANIIDVHPSIITKICDCLDENGKWRALIQVVTEKRFHLRNRDVEAIAKVFYALPMTGQTPSRSLWQKYSDLGMKVCDMHKYLEKLKLEKELKLLQKESEPLIITKPPKSMYAADCNKRIEIRCEAKGFPFPRYTWFKCAVGSTEVEEIDQNTSGVLEIKRCRKKDAGSYKCRIHNILALESGTSPDRHVLFTGWFTVDVNGEEDSDDSDDSDVPSPTDCDHERISLRIRRQTKLTNQIINMKEKLSLECKAQGALPLAYQWFKDGNVLEDQTTSKLLIEQCWPTHAGVYSCTVRSGNNSEVSSDKYHVKIVDPQLHPPDQVLVLRRSPQCLQKVCEGGQAVMSCDASTRRGVLAYKWWHQPTPGSPVKLILCGMDQLIIGPVTRQKAGKYYCEVQAVDNLTKEVIDTVRTGDCELQIIEDILPQLSSPTDKVALFIGCENYRANDRLAAVPFDIQAVQDQIHNMGFKVLSLLDLTLKEMHLAIDLLCNFTEPGVYVLLYFVGHGFYLNGNHYLMPWDVPHGTKLEECLCLEEAYAKVQHREPKLLFMVNDICREDGREKDIFGTDDVPNYPPKISGNSLIIFAASRTERSYEPVVHSGPLHEEKRGVFSRHFCQTLSEYKDRPVLEIFNYLVDCFRKKYVDTYGKKYPMHPVMEVNLLERNRKLTDVIDYTGSEIVAEKRNQKFSYITQMPKEKCLIEQKQPEIYLKLEISFEEKFSNQFVIVVNLVHAIAESKGYLSFDLSTGASHNTITKHVESGPEQTRFILSDLQRLKEDLDLVLHVLYDVGGKPKSTFKIHLMEKLSETDRDILRRPLISRHSTWSKSPQISSWSEAFPKPSGGREPRENEEVNHSSEYQMDKLSS